MKIPEFLRVDTQTQISPAHIIAVKDYGKRLELTLTNGPIIRVEGDQVAYIRSILVAKIAEDVKETTNQKFILASEFRSTTTGTDDSESLEPIHDAEFTEVKLCGLYNKCSSFVKAKDKCEGPPETYIENPACFKPSKEDIEAASTELKPSIDEKTLEPVVIEERTSESTKADKNRMDTYWETKTNDKGELCRIYDECVLEWRQKERCKKGDANCYRDK